MIGAADVEDVFAIWIATLDPLKVAVESFFDVGHRAAMSEHNERRALYFDAFASQLRDLNVAVVVQRDKKRLPSLSAEEIAVARAAIREREKANGN